MVNMRHSQATLRQALGTVEYNFETRICPQNTDLVDVDGQSGAVGEAVVAGGAHVRVPGLAPRRQQPHLLHRRHAAAAAAAAVAAAGPSHRPRGRVDSSRAPSTMVL